jgi:electron transport complex protein RnfC
MSRILESFPGGLVLETHKDISSAKESILHPLPEKLILPLQQHIGTPSQPVVKIGDKVLKGQVIARADGYVSVPIHASSSGTIIDIGQYCVPHPSNLTAPCIVIETDGEDKWFDIQPTDDFLSLDPKDLQAVIRECGIIGLGGAGFPAHVKLNEGVENQVDTLIINGVECEPYITCDDRLIQEKAHYIVAGARMIAHAVQAENTVIAVEDDMPDAYESLKKWIDDDIELVKVPARYPAGGEKQLTKVITGKEVPSGGLPIHVGIVMHNVATAAAVFRAVTRGEPIVSRYVTITGDVEEPRNLQVLLGTPVKDCVEKCGCANFDEVDVILGGPMMGMHVTHPDIPIIKTSNCILINEKQTHQPEMPCIRCGKCVFVCPVKLMPQQLYWFAKANDFDATQRWNLFDCIECGLCSYVCPSHIPLVQYYRYAKTQIANEERRQLGAEYARNRFIAKNDRLQQHADKKKALRNERHTKVNESEDKQAYIHGAVKRAKEKKQSIQDRKEGSEQNGE